MKRIIVRVAIALAVLIVLIALAIHFFLDGAIKRGVETVGPSLTKVQTKLDSVSLSLLSGSGKINGFLLGNPEGFKTPSAIQVGEASLALEPRSLFGDKIIIHSVNVQSPEITFETDLRANNLSKILANVEAATGGGSTAKPTEPGAAKANRKLQVDDFLISGGKINVSVTTLGKSLTVPLPEIHLSGLGQGPDGITAAELTKRVLQAVEKEAIQASSGAVADLSKQITNLSHDLRGSETNALRQATDGLGNLLKKK
jgi:hypothetical protein